MKTCSKCKIEKHLEEFNKHSSTKDNLTPHCKKCIKEYAQQYYIKNKSTFEKNSKEHYKKNAEVYKENTKKWKRQNKSKVVFYNKTREVAKKNRIPSWADFEKIKSYYNVCAFFNEVNGYIKYHVDHIIPLQGKLVSGLHVQNNLQVILAKDNISKGNNFTVSGY